MVRTYNDTVFFSALNEVGHTDQPRRAIKNTLLLLSKDRLPELCAAVGLTQNQHHCDDVFNHTIAVVCACRQDPVLRMAALLHDLGKVETRRLEDGKVSFHGHEDESAKIARRVLSFDPDQAELVAWLCARHMDLKAAGPDGQGLPDKSLRKLLNKAPSAEAVGLLLELCHADNISHAPASCMPNQIAALRLRFAEIASKISDQPKQVVTELVNGNEILALQPGRAAGKWVREALYSVAEAEQTGLLATKESALRFAAARFISGK